MGSLEAGLVVFANAGNYTVCCKLGVLGVLEPFYDCVLCSIDFSALDRISGLLVSMGMGEPLMKIPDTSTLHEKQV